MGVKPRNFITKKCCYSDSFWFFGYLVFLLLFFALWLLGFFLLLFFLCCCCSSFFFLLFLFFVRGIFGHNSWFRELIKPWVPQGKVAILHRQTSDLAPCTGSGQQDDSLHLAMFKSHMLFHLSAITIQLSEKWEIPSCFLRDIKENKGNCLQFSAYKLRLSGYPK